MKLVQFGNQKDKNYQKSYHIDSNGKQIDLENVLLFHNRLFSKNNTVVERVSKKIYDLLYKSRRKSYKLRQAALNNIITNLIIAYQGKKVVVISKDANFYSVHRLYSARHFTYRIIVGLLNKLESHGYIEIKNGYNIGANSRRARIWATHKIINAVKQELGTVVIPKQVCKTVVLDGKEYRLAFNDIIETPLCEDDLIQLRSTQKIKSRKVKRRIKKTSRIINELAQQICEYNKFIETTYVLLDSNILRSYQNSNNSVHLFKQAANGDINDCIITDIACNRESNLKLVKQIKDDRSPINDLSSDEHPQFSDPTNESNVPISVFSINEYNNRLAMDDTYSINKSRTPDISTSIHTISTTNTITNNNSLDHPVFIRLNCNLYRVFGETLNEGGRLYGADYQQLPNSDDFPIRNKLLINGNSVIEVDYSGLHFRMMYHLKGIDYKDDPYNIGEYYIELRPIAKKLANIMINSPKPRGIIYSIRQSVLKDANLKNLYYRYYYKDLLNIMHEKLIEKHQAIKEYFHSGMGFKLQKLDSDMAVKILLMLKSRDIPCLCVHDSFIVEEKHKDLLINSMKEVYRNHFRFECKVTIK